MVVYDERHSQAARVNCKLVFFTTAHWWEGV